MKKKIYNFSAGPACLPDTVLKKIANEINDWHGTGLSVMEMSHRSKYFLEIFNSTLEKLVNILQIPQSHSVLFMQGGATSQFSLIPMNLVNSENCVLNYVNTGQWSIKAIDAAKQFANVNICCSSEADNFTKIPPFNSWKIVKKSEYLHFTSNETIGGVEFHWDPDIKDIPVICDASSNFLSKPIEISKYGLIYAGAQKNFGLAGLTIIIIRNDLIHTANKKIPKIFSYKTMLDNDSMYNTPPTFAIYLSGLILDWIHEKGGLLKVRENNKKKSKLIYDYLDSTDFYLSPVEISSRSNMNIPFKLKLEKLQKLFLEESKEQGLIELKGHRSVGGMRASLYNAMTEDGVLNLLNFLKNFENKYG